MAGARGRARAIACQSNLHGIASTVATYLSIYSDTFPYAAPGAPIPAGPDAPAGGLFWTSGSYWDVRIHWVGIVAATAPWRENYASWVCAGSARAAGQPWLMQDPSLLGGPSYHYCSGFFARPEVWSSDSAADSKALLLSVRADEVSRPASKAQFVDMELAHVAPQGDRTRQPVLFADGHAAEVNTRHARPAGRNSFTGTAFTFFDTDRGVRGSDF